MVSVIVKTTILVMNSTEYRVLVISQGQFCNIEKKDFLKTLVKTVLLNIMDTCDNSFCIVIG